MSLNKTHNTIKLKDKHISIRIMYHPLEVYF